MAKTKLIALIILVSILTFLVSLSPVPIDASSQINYYFPQAGQSLSFQDQRQPEEVGLDPSIVADLTGSATRWALWRHGYLVHVEGDFNLTAEVKSLRKTWHALTVGAAIQQGKIPDLDQKIDTYETDLTGKDAEATWFHVLTQSAGFDYPGCGDDHDYAPGEMWTYSDLNLFHLNNALAKVYGKSSYYDNYADVLKSAYFDAIGMQGWSIQTKDDGIRLILDLEDMGRLGLLMLTGGKWNDTQLIPPWFVEALETKQTYGMQVNYNGCNNGQLAFLDASNFPEAPYGLLTWVNTDQDFFPVADSGWAQGAGAGGFIILWNHKYGIVYAAMGGDYHPTTTGVPQIIEANITSLNPLAEITPTSTPTPTATLTAEISPCPTPSPSAVTTVAPIVEASPDPSPIPTATPAMAPIGEISPSPSAALTGTPAVTSIPQDQPCFYFPIIMNFK